MLAELDHLLLHASEADIPLLLGEIAKRIVASQEPPGSILLRDRGNQPVGYFVPQTSQKKPPQRTEEEFIEVLNDRIAKPPSRFLSTREFLKLLNAR